MTKKWRLRIGIGGLPLVLGLVCTVAACGPSRELDNGDGGTEDASGIDVDTGVEPDGDLPAVCQPNPCQNGGTCTAQGTGYVCACADGFSGDTCEVDACEPNPCQHNGTCVGQPNGGYSCDCEPGWQDALCETDVDECTPTNPCQQGADCTNLQGTYECDCPPGYAGQNCDAFADSDGDGVPDLFDLFPNDGTEPGLTIMNTVYAHTSSTLYTLDVSTYTLSNLGAFVWPADGGGHQMTDIAIDEWGVLYGVTFDRLYICNPNTMNCTDLATLPSSFNGLTLIPSPIIYPDRDALVGIATSGDWYLLEIFGGTVTTTALGAYGGTYTSSGDAFSIVGVGTYAAVNKIGEVNDVLLSVDPATGTFISEIIGLSGTSTYGLAGWAGQVFAFDASGQISLVDLTGPTTSVINSDPIAWWGAGVRTRM